MSFTELLIGHFADDPTVIARYRRGDGVRVTVATTPAIPCPDPEAIAAEVIATFDGLHVAVSGEWMLTIIADFVEDEMPPLAAMYNAALWATVTTMSLVDDTPFAVPAYPSE